jgi:UDP-2-acetamido-2-deoxy-ribo-hexuluronate aminotransferase
MEFIDLKKQQSEIKEDIDKRISNVLAHGKYIMGPEVFELEEELKKYTGAKNVITVSSGTDALLISLMALGIKKGDEVITTPFSFASSAEVIKLVGAKPVFVDVFRETGNINEKLIENLINKNTKAIIAVSLYGQTPDFDLINHVAEKYKNITVIEDGAQSFGATYKNKRSGNLSAIGCTSFFPSKPLGCYGDGGAIFVKDDKIAEKCKSIRVHGQKERYVHKLVGLCGRMDTIQCAIVLAKLVNFEWEVTKRQEVASKYDEIFDASGINRMQVMKDRTSVYAQYTLSVDNREGLIDCMAKHNIPYAIHYPNTLDKQAPYIDLNDKREFLNADELSRNVISIPMHPYLNIEDQNFIASTIVEFFNN